MNRLDSVVEALVVFPLAKLLQIFYKILGKVLA
jgi:hypothetical protein